MQSRKKSAQAPLNNRLARIAITLPLVALATLSSSCATGGLDDAPYGPQGQPGQQVQYVQYVQTAAPGQPQRIYAQQELDQMLAPIALYPDALLAQILMAATYPAEVAEAALWSRANPGFSGSQAVQAVEQAGWDTSVKSLVAFPQILKIMHENPRWTESLGEAFMAQQAQVMNTIQTLRQRAMAQGSLRSNDEIYVYPQGQVIIIQPVRPDVIYVPYYDPNVVYGPWWWAGYPPVYWQPWPGYYSRPSYAPGYAWSSGIIVGSGFFFGIFDWNRHHVRNAPVEHGIWDNHRQPPPAPGLWQHDPAHRRDTRRDGDHRDQRDPRDTRDYRQQGPQQQMGRPAPPQAPQQQFIRPAAPLAPQQVIVRPAPPTAVPEPASARPPAPDARRDQRGHESSADRQEEGRKLQPRVGPAARPDLGNQAGAQPSARPGRPAPAAPAALPAAPVAPMTPATPAPAMPAAPPARDGSSMHAPRVPQPTVAAPPAQVIVRPASVERGQPGAVAAARGASRPDAAATPGVPNIWRGGAGEVNPERATERPVERPQERSDRMRPFQPQGDDRQR